MASKEANPQPGYWVVRSTWLSKKPSSKAFQLMFVLSLALTILAQMNWFDLLSASRWMPASPELVFNKGELWRAWTTVFAHADLEHLLSNAFLFFILGSFLTSYFGKLLIPVTAFTFGGLINLIVLKTMPLQSHLIGASGIVFWMGGAWLTLFFLLDRRRSITQRALRSIGVAIMLFVPSEAFDPNISYKAHMVGFFMGVLWAVPYYLWNRPRFLRAEASEWITEEDPEDSIKGVLQSAEPSSPVR